MKKLLIIILVSIPFAYASAGGITVSPSKLTFDIERGKIEKANIVVTNPTADVQVFEVYPDNFSDVISINPKSFTLEAGMNKSVQISVSQLLSRNTPQVMTTNLSVIARPLTEIQFQANTGVKIPITISVQELPRTGGVITLMEEIVIGIIIIIALISAMIYFSHKYLFRKHNVA
ncbi:MAG: hypothetical protein HYV65_03110 [Candidatus Spechtbacteria bacterium]|nr:hypothetical protein [Candidatus Spechtbacteria bacterium]